MVGIFSQTIDEEDFGDPKFANKTSYIMSAYTKFVEAQGARVVPLIREESDETTLWKVERLNGVLYPGGGGDYYEKGKLVWDRIIQYNDGGQFYPMWGTCLGFEHFVAYTATA